MGRPATTAPCVDGAIDHQHLHRVHLRDVAVEFERAVRTYARIKDATLDLKAIIDHAAPGHMTGEWQRSRHLRNRAVHGRALNDHEVAELIDCTRRILSLSKETGVRTGRT